MSEEINQFVERLARCDVSGCVFNQYAYAVEANAIRRNNLLLYLQQMRRLQPRMLLVGEAPGYRGCRLTGVPFTSEFILLEGLAGVGLFGEGRGYRQADEGGRVGKEASASMVWEVLLGIGEIPLLWNAFPFHPFCGENGLSNRKPTRAEVGMGGGFLRELMGLFEIEGVVAVGKTAAGALGSLGVDCWQVRHPSHGGKVAFARGMREVVGSLGVL